MVRACEGLQCRRKKKKYRMAYKYSGSGQVKKLVPIQVPTKAALPSWKEVDPMIAAFGGSEKFVTKDPSNQAWNAISGIGQTVLEGLGYSAGIPGIAAVSRAVQNLAKLGYTPKIASLAVQTFMKHRFPSVFGKSAPSLSRFNVRKGVFKASRGPTIKSVPSTPRGSPGKVTIQSWPNTPNKSSLKSVPKYRFNATNTTGKSGAGVWGHSGDASIYVSPKNAYSRIGNKKSAFPYQNNWQHQHVRQVEPLAATSTVRRTATPVKAHHRKINLKTGLPGK